MGRRLRRAVACLEDSEQPLAASVISIAELYVGVRDGEERLRLDAFVKAFEVLPLDREAAVVAGLWRWHYGPSHDTRLADALIAASGGRCHPGDHQPSPFPLLPAVLVLYAKG